MADAIQKIVDGENINNCGSVVNKGSPSSFVTNEKTTDAPSISDVDTKLDNRFDDKTYYTT